MVLAQQQQQQQQQLEAQKQQAKQQQLKQLLAKKDKPSKSETWPETLSIYPRSLGGKKKINKKNFLKRMWALSTTIRAYFQQGMELVSQFKMNTVTDNYWLIYAAAMVIMTLSCDMD